MPLALIAPLHRPPQSRGVSISRNSLSFHAPPQLPKSQPLCPCVVECFESASPRLRIWEAMVARRVTVRAGVDYVGGRICSRGKREGGDSCATRAKGTDSAQDPQQHSFSKQRRQTQLSAPGTISVGRKEKGRVVIKYGKVGGGRCLFVQEQEKREKERDIHNMRVKLAGIWNVPSSLPSAERAQGALPSFQEKGADGCDGGVPPCHGGVDRSPQADGMPIFVPEGGGQVHHV